MEWNISSAGTTQTTQTERKQGSSGVCKYPDWYQTKTMAREALYYSPSDKLKGKFRLLRQTEGENWELSLSALWFNFDLIEPKVWRVKTRPWQRFLLKIELKKKLVNHSWVWPTNQNFLISFRKTTDLWFALNSYFSDLMRNSNKILPLLLKENRWQFRIKFMQNL